MRVTLKDDGTPEAAQMADLVDELNMLCGRGTVEQIAKVGHLLHASLVEFGIERGVAGLSPRLGDTGSSGIKPGRWPVAK